LIVESHPHAIDKHGCFNPRIFLSQRESKGWTQTTGTATANPANPMQYRYFQSIDTTHGELISRESRILIVGFSSFFSANPAR
jgi:hypothetical protein